MYFTGKREFMQQIGRIRGSSARRRPWPGRGDRRGGRGGSSRRSFRELESGRLRYGLRAIEKDPHARDFLATLQRISLAVQRDQLQRTGGAR